MMRNKILLFSVLFVALACFPVTSALSQEKTAIRIGTSSVGSAFYTLAVAISKLLQDEEKLASTVEAVGGSTPNVIALGTDRVDVAITNSFAAFNGYFGQERFAQRGAVDLGLLAVGNPSLRQFVVRKGAGVNDIPDLVGRIIVGRRPALPEIEMITNAMLKAYNVDPSKLRIIATTETNEVMSNFASNAIDGAWLPGSLRDGSMVKAAQEGQISFFSFPKDKMDAMMSQLPSAFENFTVPANTYTNQNEPYVTINLATMLVGSSKHFSEENGYKLMKAIFDNINKFRTYHATAEAWSVENTLRSFSIPFHPGAIRYFKEKGLWTGAVEKRHAELIAKRK